MDKAKEFILWFDQLGIEDVPHVGGKNASLGEMYKNLSGKGVRVPNGFAVTAYAYNYFVESTKIKDNIRKILSDLNTSDMKNLSERGDKVRTLFLNTELPQELKNKITEAYWHLCKQYGENTDVAVRSSATAEDLPDASFAGQQETFLNIRGPEQLIEACRKCFASLFTNRAISYRVDKKFDHFQIALSIGVQKMVRSDLACSGVMFSIDTESGFPDVVFVTAAYGLGENIVQGAVNPDEYYVHKPTLKKGFRSIVHKELGEKAIKMIYTHNSIKPTKNIDVPAEERTRFALTDDEALLLAKWACIIEDHYSQKAGHFKPMDMEWAKDGKTNELFIVQARPETVQSSKDKNTVEEYKLLKKGKVIAAGKSVGEKIGAGDANIIKNVHDIGNFRKGQILVTDMTDPDWEPIMKIASAIVTNRGGRTCFGADTKVLTNLGFRTMEEIYDNYEDIKVVSVNRTTLKTEWKPVVAVMKRRSDIIEIGVSQTGKMCGNTLRLTKDHKMLTFENATLVEKEIQQILLEEQLITTVQKIPSLNDPTLREEKLAYLLGAISTDGSIYKTDRHGEVQFIQKPTPEKFEFIEQVKACMNLTFGKEFKTVKKKKSEGIIRGKPAIGEANAYRCYSKGIAQELLLEQENMVSTLLLADRRFILNFMGGIIDGDGCFNQNSKRINIYISKQPLLEAVVVSCLRLGISPQISVNRSINNIQITEKIDELLMYTKRVKGKREETRQGTRFFSARQLFEKADINSDINLRIRNNLLIDEEKLKQISVVMDNLRKNRLNRILESDLRMQRVKIEKEAVKSDVYNITVAGNHNYVVFTERYTPVLVNNCHAAIISRELGIPCVVGTIDATEKIRQGQNITVDCSQGDEGFVYDGLLEFKVQKTNLKDIPKTKTKIMMNLANPEEAFEMSFLPNQGVGLAREEFIINSFIKIHPLALLSPEKVTDPEVKAKIEKLTKGYKNKVEYYTEKLALGIARIAAAFYPKDVILRFSDFKSNEYANLIGGKFFEPKEDNPMIGWRGASRYYSPEFRDAFGLECKAVLKVRNELGLTNLKVMIPFCRTTDEAEKVLATMELNGLKRGENSLEVMCMCEIPANVILAEEFLDIFDGFSIGSNDLTQLTLGLDRDSELVASIYDERNSAVKKLIQHVITVAVHKGRYIGICGQAPSDYPDFAEFLVESGIHSISLNPDTVVKTTIKIAEKEKQLGVK
jgi:pyruvate,water dikinase